MVTEVSLLWRSKTICFSGFLMCWPAAQNWDPVARRCREELNLSFPWCITVSCKGGMEQRAAPVIWFEMKVWEGLYLYPEIQELMIRNWPQPVLQMSGVRGERKTSTWPCMTDVFLLNQTTYPQCPDICKEIRTGWLASFFTHWSSWAEEELMWLVRWREGIENMSPDFFLSASFE